MTSDLEQDAVLLLRLAVAEFIGYVEAPDEESAIKEAIPEHGITDPWRQNGWWRRGEIEALSPVITA